MAESFSFMFIRPLWLLLLPVVWLVIWFFSRCHADESMWRKFCDPYLLNILVPNAIGRKKNIGLAWMLVFILTVSLIAVAGPSWRKQPIPVFQSNAARVIVLDLSRSMLARDVDPSRFQRAVFKIKDIINQDKDSQVALVAFAGAAFVVSPLTDDRQTLINFLDSLNPQIMPVQGSRLDLAINLAIKMLSISTSLEGDIIILSDGVSDLNSTVDVAKKANEKGFKVSILAVGTEQGGPIQDAQGKLLTDNQGQLIIAKVRLSELTDIATAGGGNLVRFTPTDADVKALYAAMDNNDYSRAEKNDEQSLILPVNDGVWLIWLILPLILLLFRKNALFLLLAVLILPMTEKTHAFDWAALWKNKEQRAHQALKEGDYDAVGQLSANPELKGSAAYKAQNFAQSAQLFASVDSAQSHYNRGNALAQQQQFQPAIDAYEQALSRDPQLEDAKYNKNLVQEMLKQQETEQEKSPGEDENQQDESEQDDSKNQRQSEHSQSTQSDQQSSDADQKNKHDPQESAEPQGSQEPTQPQEPEKLADDKDKQTDNETAQEEQQQIQQNLQETQDAQSIERWINRLPDDPSELLRRKFLRDYQRQRNQP